MPDPKRKPPVMKILNGNMPPLSTHQRRLVEIFVWYLRQLPEWKEPNERGCGGSWGSGEYHLVNLLLMEYFKAKNPVWVQRKDGNRYSYSLADLPAGDAEEYRALMHNAAPTDDGPAARLLERRRKLLEVARDKLWVIEFMERYEQKREELGLPPDITLPSKPATPLERAAAQTWPA